MNVPFTEADLASHKHACTCGRISSTFKGGTPVDMRLLLLSLKAIERVCGQERSEKSNASHDKKASHSKKKGTNRPGTDNNARVPKKARTKKHCNLCKKHGGAYTTHNTCDCRRFKKDGMEKSDFFAAKKGGKKPNPTKQSFAQ
jgi:hypothetical protein